MDTADSSDGVELAGLRIEGSSIGGIETCLEVPEYKLAFDIGRCPPSALRLPTILFTHAHIDHLGGVAFHAATRALRHMPKPTYFVPRHAADAFRDLCDVWRRLDGSDLPHRLVEAEAGEEAKLPNGLIVRPFKSPHRVPCLGYGLWSHRRKLAPRYRGASPAEIRALKASGAVVTNPVEVPELVFTGDTRIEVLEREEVVRKARRLIMEVTFVDDRVSVEDCRAKGHVHLYEVAERADLFENEAILFTHFSSRYRPADVLRALDRTLPAELRARVTPLLAGL